MSTVRSRQVRFKNRLLPAITTTLLSLAIVMAAFATILPVNQASAMGQAPSTCSNVYGGTITSFLISYPGGGKLDALANPNSTFSMPSVGATYDVSFVIHTANTSDGSGGSAAPNNSLPGDTWYGTTAPGWGNGVCIRGAGPNQDITINLRVAAPPIAGHTNHPVPAEWYTLAPGAGEPIINSAVSVQYAVVWPLLTSSSSGGGDGNSLTISSTSTSTSTTSTSLPSSSSTTVVTSSAMTIFYQLIAWLLILIATLLMMH